MRKPIALNLDHLWQPLSPDLPADFPPLYSINVVPNYLPGQLSSFIGREEEMAEIKQALAEHRLKAWCCAKTTKALLLTGSLPIIFTFLVHALPTVLILIRQSCLLSRVWLYTSHWIINLELQSRASHYSIWHYFPAILILPAVGTKPASLFQKSSEINMD